MNVEPPKKKLKSMKDLTPEEKEKLRLQLWWINESLKLIEMEKKYISRRIRLKSFYLFTHRSFT